MSRLISLALFLIVGILVYNYFFGDEAEKARAKNVFSKTKELGLEIKDLVKAERVKYDEGKYDKIVNKIKNVVGKDDELNDKYSSQLNEIDELQDELKREQRRKSRSSSNYDEEKEDELKIQLDGLLKELSNNLSK